MQECTAYANTMGLSQELLGLSHELLALSQELLGQS